MSRHGPIEIGLREIYDLLQEVRSEVQELRAEALGQSRAQADHEVRLRTLERARWPLPSLAVLVAAASVLVALFRPG